MRSTACARCKPARAPRSWADTSGRSSGRHVSWEEAWDRESSRWSDAELLGPFAHIAQGLVVDGNAVGEALALRDELRLAREEDLSLRAQVLDHGPRGGLQRLPAGEAPGVERHQEVPDLARMLEVLVHVVDVAPEGHAVERAAQQVDH